MYSKCTNFKSVNSSNLTTTYTESYNNKKQKCTKITTKFARSRKKCLKATFQSTIFNPKIQIMQFNIISLKHLSVIGLNSDRYFFQIYDYPANKAKSSIQAPVLPTAELSNI